MKVHIDTERKHACVVSSSDIKKLWMWLEEHVGVVTARIKCSDDGTREFEDLENLTSYDNPSTKQIVALYIESHSDGWEKSVDVKFSNGEFSSINIKAHEQTASEIREKISDILDGTRPWYSRLALVHHSSSGMMVTLLIVALISLIAAPHIWTGFSDFEYMRQLLLTTMVTIWLLAGLGWLRPRLFPTCCFALGQGEHRYGRLVNIHRAILAFSATVIISLLVASIYQ